MRHIFEHKFWYKTISDFLDWFKSISNNTFIFIDSETTGLPSDNYDVQLTQISCIVYKYDFNSNQFTKIDDFNKKIKLTKYTLDNIKNKPNIKRILSFNRYGEKGQSYQDEVETLSEFYMFTSKYPNSIFMIQNASFDMKYLNTRGLIKFKNQILDIKQVIQLFYLPCILKLSESDKFYKDLIDKIGTSNRDFGLLSSSMGKVAPALGIDMSGYHNALVDCELAMKMFQKIIEFLKDKQYIDISKYQKERIKTKK